MTKDEAFVAELIQAGASGYATVSAQLLLSRSPQTEQRFGRGALQRWSRHLAQRLHELAAAVLVAEPRLFVNEVQWSRIGWDAREVPTDELRTSLECLRDALDEELPETARDLPRDYLSRALEALGEPLSRDASPLTDEISESPLALEYLEAALRGRRRAAIALVLDSIDNGMPPESVFDQVLLPAQRSVGELWHAHQLSIAQEHFVTATTESLMALVAHHEEAAEPNGRKIVVSMVQGNAHELGARALAYRFDMAGYDAIYLGTELPASELAVGLEAFEADLLALSVAMSTQLPAAVETIRAARAARPGLKVLVGGRIFNSVPGLWERVGADGAATTADEALAVAEEL